MTFDWAEWGPPLAVLVVGLIGGAFLVARSRLQAGEQAAITREGARMDLEKRHETVVEALRALELEKDKLTPDDYQPTFTFYAYLILILGGTTRIWAIPVGALLFGLLYSGTRFLNFYPLSLIDSGDRAYLRLILVGLLLIVLMAIRPQGIFGNRRELLLR